MIGSAWNAFFVTLAMGAGMFAQQAAHKISAASEDKQIGSLVGLELFCSAEGYYLAGRFKGCTTGTETPGIYPVSSPADEQPTVAESDSQQDDPMKPTEPAAESENPGPELAAAAETPAAPEAETAVEGSSAIGAEPAPAAPQPPVPGPVAEVESKEPVAEMPEVSAPETTGQTLAVRESAEVLPPPAPDKAPRLPSDDFGKFVDDPTYVAPPRSPVRPPLPSTMTGPDARTYYDATAGQAGRYVSPSDLVRERAVARGEQRRQRIEIRKWLGVSPLRPAVDSTPFTAVEQPQQLLLVIPDTSPTVKR
jgi:hypothetical protein